MASGNKAQKKDEKVELEGEDKVRASLRRGSTFGGETGIVFDGFTLRKATAEDEERLKRSEERTLAGAAPLDPIEGQPQLGHTGEAAPTGDGGTPATGANAPATGGNARS